MPYDKYTRNGDGTTTFSGNGLDDLMGYGPAADAHASRIDALNQPGALASNAPMAPQSTDLGDIDARQGQTTLNEPPAANDLDATVASLEKLDAARRAPAAKGGSVTRFDQAGNVIGATDFSASGTPIVAPKPAAPVAASAPEQATRVRMYQGVGGAAPAAATSPVRHVAEHEQAVGRTTQKTILPEEDKQNIDVGGGLTMNAATSITDAEALQAEQIAQQKRLEVANLQDQNQRMQSREEMRQSTIKQRVDDMNKVQTDLSNETIDSTRFWTKKTDAEKFVAAISMALGTFASIKGKTGSNPAVDLINKAVNDSIADQQSNLANKRASANAQQTILADYRSVLGDERAADAATRAHMLDMAAQRIDAIIGDNASPVIRARGEEAKAQIMNQVYAEKRKVNAYVQHESYKTIAAHDEGGVAPGLVAHPDDDRFVQLDDGTTLHATNAKAAEDMEQKLSAVDKIKRARANLRTMLGNPSLADAKAVGLEVNNIITALAPLSTGAGRGTPMGEMHAVNEVLPTSGTINLDLTGQLTKALDVVEHEAGAVERHIKNSAPHFSGEMSDPKTGKSVFVPMPRRRVEELPTEAGTE